MATATSGTAGRARYRSSGRPATSSNRGRGPSSTPPWPRATRRWTDHNRPGALGVGPLPRNVRDGTRMSTALTYLGPARSRPTLELRAGTLVDRVVLVHGRARGVQLAGGEVVEADGVVLAAGAYGSPAILLRSGIGPAGHLRALGLPIIAHRPGVGANLVDHPLVAVDLPATPGRRGPAFSVLLTMRSSLTPPADPPDLHVFLAGPFDDPSVPSGAVAGIVTGLLSPRSRGSLRLRSADPAEPPLIDPAYLRHPDDMTRMVEATREARRIGRTTPLVELVPGPEIAPGEAVSRRRRVGALDPRTGGALPPPRRDVRDGTGPGGPAVVDARGSVHGVDRLWVADASVMPTIPSAGTNLPTIVVAERIAAWLVE